MSTDDTSTGPATGTAQLVRTAFVWTAGIEAVSWVFLLASMAFKYGPSENEIGVQVFGPIHGVVFLAYVAATVAASRTFSWNWRLLLVGLAASIPPLATWPFEQFAARRGKLSA